MDRNHGQGTQSSVMALRAYPILHDVSPLTWKMYAAFLDENGLYDLPWTLLLIPDHHGRAPLASGRHDDFLRTIDRPGWEWVMHGFEHRVPRPVEPDKAVTPRWRGAWERLWTLEGECMTLDRASFDTRWLTARTIWQHFGRTTTGFVPPGWRLRHDQVDWLRHAGFVYYESLSGIHDLASGRHRFCPSLCFSTRAAWRRRASLGFNLSVWFLARHGRFPCLRMSLHPDDLAITRIRAFWAHALRVMSRERVLPTLGGMARP
jgi:predicted deacetylase